MENDDTSNENYIEYKSNNMKNNDAPKSMSETYASILKKDLRSKNDILRQKPDDEK